MKSQKHLDVDQVEDLNFDELVIEARHRMLITLKGLYWEKFELGQCSPESVLLLT